MPVAMSPEASANPPAGFMRDYLNYSGQTQTVPADLPPLLRQYVELKEQHQDSLIFIQVGDFYEAFFADARRISQELNLTLTSRDKKAEEPIAMCGVPLAAVDGYIKRLNQLDYTVAVISQTKAKDADNQFQRSLERLVTPAIGLLSDQQQLCGKTQSETGRDSQTIVAISRSDAADSYSVVAFVSGHNRLEYQENLSEDAIKLALAALAPRELLLADRHGEHRIDGRNQFYRLLAKRYSERLIKLRNTATARLQISDLKEVSGFDQVNYETKTAALIIADYLEEVTAGAGDYRIKTITPLTASNNLQIDASTQSNLDLLVNQRTGLRAGSLLAYLDYTKSNAGYKLLRSRILSPLTEHKQIDQAQQTTEFFLQNTALRQKVQKILANLADLTQLAARIELNVVSPLELGALRDTLWQVSQLAEIIATGADESDGMPEQIRDFIRSCSFHNSAEFPTELVQLLTRALQEKPPLRIIANQAKAGLQCFQPGYRPELGPLHELSVNAKQAILDLELLERKRSGIPTLKIKFNNSLLYYFELTKTHAAKAPEDFIPRQTTVNSARFISDDLKDLERKILSAQSDLLLIETDLFEQLKTEILPHTDLLRAINLTVAALDLHCSFGELAARDNLTRPKILESTEPVLKITAGRHPVLAESLRQDFVANDSNFCAEHYLTMILTGPNMGGKSTYLRQQALIVIMAQIGSYVPAATASLTTVDRLFARIGASDDQQQGDSTFMVEMREAALIVNHASSRSLILIDELGRGTSAQDGQALAYAILQWLSVKLKARLIFATHYHQITALADQHAWIANYCVEVAEVAGSAIFTHCIKAGKAGSSYGLQVAASAGLPAELIENARELRATNTTNRIDDTEGSQIELFSAAANPGKTEPKKVAATQDILLLQQQLNQNLESLSRLRSQVMAVDPDQLTPKSALDFLYELQENIE